MNNENKDQQDNKVDFDNHHSSIGNSGGNLNVEGEKINDERLEKVFDDIRNKPAAALVIVVPKEADKQKTIQIGSVIKTAALLAGAAKEDPNFA